MRQFYIYNSFMKVVDCLVDLSNACWSTWFTFRCLWNRCSYMFHFSWVCNWNDLTIFCMLKQAIIKHALHLAMHVFISFDVLSELIDFRLHLMHLAKFLIYFHLLLLSSQFVFFNLYFWSASLGIWFKQMAWNALRV